MLKAIEQDKVLVIGTPDHASPIVNQYMHEMEIIYRKLGFEIRAHPAPSRRMVLEANRGTLDGLILVTDLIQEQATNLQIVNVPMTTIDMVVISRPDIADITNVDQLRGLRVGHILGYESTGHMLREMQLKPRSMPVDTYDLLINMLDKDRLDAALILRRESYRFAAKHEEYSYLKLHPKPLFTYHLYHFIHKKHMDIHAQLEQEMAKQWALGELDARVKAVTPESPFH